MNDENLAKQIETLSRQLGDLTGVLTEIKDWLNSKRVGPVPTPDPMSQTPSQQYKCPLCNGPMKKRMARATGEEFYGCSAYPDCTGTRNLDGKNTTRPGCRPKARPNTAPPIEVPPYQGEEDVPF